MRQKKPSREARPLAHPAFAPYGKDVPLYRRFPSEYSVSMKKIYKEGESVSENVEVSQVKRLVVLAAVGLKLGRKILEKLESIEVSIEVIAREVERQAEQGE